jgi:hypothetical protein
LRWGDDDFFNASTGTPGWLFTGGSNRQVNDADGVGVTEIVAPVSATGQVAATLYTFTLALICGGIFVLSTNGYFWMSLRFKLPSLASESEGFEGRWGLGNVVSGDPTQSMYFSHDANASSKIQFNMANGGAPTTTPTNVDMVADTWYHGEARMSPSDPGQIYVYIDGDFQFKTSTNRPTNLLGPYWAIRKQFGAGQPTSRMDWHKGNYKFPSNRVLLA